jgi:hypothetical protein
MGETIMSDAKKGDRPELSSQDRRRLLRKLGRFTVVTAPAVTLLLAAQTKPAGAVVVSCAALAQPTGKTKIV